MDEYRGVRRLVDCLASRPAKAELADRTACRRVLLPARNARPDLDVAACRRTGCGVRHPSVQRDRRATGGAAVILLPPWWPDGGWAADGVHGRQNHGEEHGDEGFFCLVSVQLFSTQKSV
jgi:hypothetical protein